MKNPTITNGAKIKDAINPAHYQRENAMQCIDEMKTLFGTEETKIFCKLNAWKYRYRAAEKNGKEDMQKSDWYIAKYKELEKEQAAVFSEGLNLV